MDRKFESCIESPDLPIHAQASDPSDNHGTLVTSRSSHRNPSYDFVSASISPRLSRTQSSRPIVAAVEVHGDAMR